MVAAKDLDALMKGLNMDPTEAHLRAMLGQSTHIDFPTFCDIMSRIQSGEIKYRG